MKTRALSLVGLVLLAATGACRDSSGPKPVLTPCTTTSTGATDLALAPGQVTVLQGGSAATCVRVPASSTGADYVFIVTDVNPKIDVVESFTFDAGPLATATAATGSLAPAGVLVEADGVAPAPSFANAHEAAIRNFERAYFKHASPLLASRAATGGAAGALAARGALAAAVAVPTVGQSMPFRVPTTDVNKNACTTYDSLTAVVKYVGQSSIVAQDVNAPANGFTDADFKAIADEFDQKIYATDVSYFGTPSDIDVNGRVVLLFTPFINKATPRGSTSFYAGFFFAGDLYPRTGASSTSPCLESNVGELFYLLVPDPTGAFSDPHTASYVRQITRGTVAHEFEHMINASIRKPNDLAQFEETWLDEGLAHFAEEAVGRAQRGFTDLQPLGYSDVAAVPADYTAFFDQNLRRFRDWLKRPDTSSGPSAHADANLSSRGAAWALLRYTADNYSGGDVRGFTRRLVAGPETGIQNLTARAGASYETVLAGHLVANYADDLTIAGLDPKFLYPSWRMRDAVAGATGGNYPLLVTSISTSGTKATGKMRSGAAAYYRWSQASAAPALGVRLLNGTGSGAATWTGARLVVLRVR